MSDKTEPLRKRPRVDACSEDAEVALPLQGLSIPNYVLNGEHFVMNNNVPAKHNYRLRWQERLSASCTPHTSFIFEISYAVEIEDLFFQTQFQLLPYSPSRFDRYLTYTVVKNVLPPLSPIVQEGDILLRINSNDMVIKDADSKGV
eukprot:gene42094-51393_t